MSPRNFLRVTAKFDNDKRPKSLLIPVDRISYVSENLSSLGGCELHWNDDRGDRLAPTTTHVQEDHLTLLRRLNEVGRISPEGEYSLVEVTCP